MSESNVEVFPQAENQMAEDADKYNEMVPKDVGGVSGERLKSFIERIERLEEEKAALAEDIKDVYSEAKATGFDTKIIRKVIKLKSMDREKRQEEEELLDLYMSAVGIV